MNIDTHTKEVGYKYHCGGGQQILSAESYCQLKIYSFPVSTCILYISHYCGCVAGITSTCKCSKFGDQTGAILNVFQSVGLLGKAALSTAAINFIDKTSQQNNLYLKLHSYGYLDARILITKNFPWFNNAKQWFQYFSKLFSMQFGKTFHYSIDHV